MAEGNGAKPPRIVAELGRPETPEETAERKAENSRKHRANQTVRNLVYSLLATLVVVFVLVAVVVRPGPEQLGSTDWHEIAASAQPDAAVPLADPALPAAWTANSATFSTSSDDISTWYIGFITPGPSTDYVGFKQGINANTTWVSQQLEEQRITGTEELGGATWDVYDHRDAEDPGNFAYAMVATLDTTSYLVYGTASTDDIRTVAAAALQSVTSGASE